MSYGKKFKYEYKEREERHETPDIKSFNGNGE